MLVGVALLARGWYLIANDLPDDSIHRLRVTVQATWMIWGIALLAFGAYGLVTGALGMIRKGVDAIDLELGPDRAVVNGSHTTGVIRMRGGRLSARSAARRWA